MKLIVGLGNPEEKYKNNRHNVGFIILDEFAKKQVLDWNYDKKAKSKIAKGSNFILLKPLTFMNLSGEAVRACVDFYKIDSTDVIVVHDELDLAFGKNKFQINISSAGHRGIESIVDNIKTQNFWRYRIGIGRPESGELVEKYVLSDFEPAELAQVKSYAELLTTHIS